MCCCNLPCLCSQSFPAWALVAAPCPHTLTHCARAPIPPCCTLLQLYKSTGLIGLRATTTPGGAAKALDALTARLEALAKGPSEGALAAAKGVALGGYQSAIAAKVGLREHARGAVCGGAAKVGLREHARGASRVEGARCNCLL